MIAQTAMSVIRIALALRLSSLKKASGTVLFQLTLIFESSTQFEMTTKPWPFENSTR